MPINDKNISFIKMQNLIINREYLPILKENGLLDFHRIYYSTEGVVIKKIKDRCIIRIELYYQKNKYVFYLKKHYPKFPSIGTIIANLIFSRGISEGVKEFKNICDFRLKGIATIEPVGTGEKRDKLGRYYSFLITEDMSPFVSLEEILCSSSEMINKSGNMSQKKKLIKTIALFAKRMHYKGFNHRDFNATHILLHPGLLKRKICLGLFDLQRIDRKRIFRFKWFIKTIAELCYSLPEPIFDEYDKISLYKEYREIQKMNMIDKLIFFAIKLKAKRIAKHTKKIFQNRNREMQKKG